MDLSISRVRDAVPPRFEGHADRLAYLLAEYKIGVYIAAAALFVLFATDTLSVEIPTWAHHLASGFALGILPAMLVGKRLADRWLPDPRVKVIEIDADAPAIDPKRIPRDLWDQRETVDLPIWQIREGETDAVVTEIDHIEATNTLKVRGVNPELADPTSIAARDGQLAAVFGDLVEKARELNAQTATEGMRQIEIEDRALMEVVRAVEKGASVDPGGFDDLILPEGEKVREQEREIETPRRTETVEDTDRPTVDQLLGEESEGLDPILSDGGER